MATGTDGGLLDSIKAQSVLKHGVLRRYVIQFAVMTSARLTPRRAVLVDGFAGRGRFDDGKPASAELLMLDAQKAKGTGTQVDVFLVEQNVDDFDRLDAVADEYRGRGLRIDARHGDCHEFLPEAVELARGASLFLFLDPCGANIPMESLVTALRDGRGEAWPRTEALLNVSADLIRRMAGLYYKVGDDADTRVLDVMCGGQWWREVAVAAYEAAGKVNWTVAADAVVQEYATRIAKAVGGTGWAISEVRRKQHHQPVYYLVFLTRDHNGFWVFGESSAKARYEWLERLAVEADDDQLVLDPFDPAEQRKTEQAQFKEQARVNLSNYLDGLEAGTQFVPIREFESLQAEIYGDVEEKTVNAVIREAEKEGRIEVVTTHAKTHRRTYRKLG